MPVNDSIRTPTNSAAFDPQAARVQVTNSSKAIFLLLLLAFALRLGWMLYNTQAIENEGTEYARIAQNLLAGKGYVGLLGGPESMFPPLFPFLIAASSLVTRDTEMAGRLVSIVMGSLLVLPVFFMGEKLFGRRVAYLAAALIAVHPLLVALSASVYVESTYLTLLFASLYFGMRVLDFDGVKQAFFCGLMLGLAYLTRPEGLAYGFLVGFFMLLAVALRKSSITTTLKYGATIAVTAVILVIPYAAYLSAGSGAFRLEGKSGLNGIIKSRMDQGMSYREAARWPSSKSRARRTLSCRRPILSKSPANGRSVF